MARNHRPINEVLADWSILIVTCAQTPDQLPDTFVEALGCVAIPNRKERYALESRGQRLTVGLA